MHVWHYPQTSPEASPIKAIFQFPIPKCVRLATKPSRADHACFCLTKNVFLPECLFCVCSCKAMGFCLKGSVHTHYLPYVDTYIPGLRPRGEAAKVNKNRRSRQGGHLSGTTYIGQCLWISGKYLEQHLCRGGEVGKTSWKSLQMPILRSKGKRV